MATSSGHIPDTPLKQLTPLPEPFYWPQDETLTQHRQNARVILRSYNLTATVALPGESMPEIEKRRAEMLGKLFGKIDIENPPFIEPPFQCDYGYNIECGSKTYMNFGCVILDCAKVTIGDKCLFGPNVQIYCPGHPLDPVLRNGFDGPEYAEPISIGNDVWVGGNAIILSGVTIGDGAVVGAGSVVTKNVESMTVVAGNPAKLIRKIEKGDMGHRKWNWAAMK